MRTVLDLPHAAAIFAGGVMGGLIRTGLADRFPPAAGSWPWVTFGVNIAGCFILAALVVRLQERLPPSVHRRPFLGTGLCGTLTTFSTVQVEAIRLARDGSTALAAVYVATSLVVGFAAVMAGTALVRRAWRIA